MDHASGSRIALALTIVSMDPAAAQPDAAASGELARVRIEEIPHTTGSIDVDGVLDEPVWQRALIVPLDVETSPRENVTAAVRTDAYLAEDGDRLLIAFDARDPHPEQIRAYLRDRDTAFSDDIVGVVLDSFNDGRRAFEFFVNALGVQMDMTLDDVNGDEDDSWNAIWDSAGRIGEHGYVVEMAIPFSQIRFQRVDGPQTWGVDLLRFHPRQNRVRLSNNTRERGRNCYLCQLSKIEGFEDAEAGRNIEVVPTITASRTDRREDLVSGPMIAGDPDTEIGLGLRWGVTPDITLNMALNPDFSQVEADVPQLDVNNQFALFYPESRPFFLEAANYFSTPINVVFTRTIADPDVGAKVTGQLDDNQFGFFAAEDAVTNLLFPGALGSSSGALDQSNHAVVGRYNRGFGENSTIGAVVTSRSGDGYSNAVVGFDGRYRWNGNNSFRFDYVRSETSYPDRIVADFDQPEGSFAGDALQLNYNFNLRNWFANANYLRTEPGFRADSGFVSRVDYKRYNVNVGHIWWPGADAWWSRIQAGANTGESRDFAGRLLENNVQAFVNFQGPMQSYMQTSAWSGQEYWDGTVYDTDGAFVYGEFRPMRALNLSFSVNRSEQIDYANSRLGDQLSMEPSLGWNVNRHLLVRFRQTYSKLDTKAGESIFDARLTDLRMTWQFNLRSFLRLTVQQQVIERNPAVYSGTVDTRSETMGTQLLYSYKVNPQTVVYAGYSDSQLANDEVVDLTRQDRTMFVKFGYAWAP